MKLSKTSLREERRVCARWLTGGLVKMKIVVCQSSVHLDWVTPCSLTHTGPRRLRFAVCVGGVKEEKVVTAICSTSRDHSYH